MVQRHNNWSNAGDFFLTTPVTKIIIGIWVIGFLAAFARYQLDSFLAFHPDHFPYYITGLVTYPLAGAQDPISLLINGLMLWWFGGSLERSWGPRKYLGFLALVSIAGIIVWEAGVWLFTQQLMPLGTPWLMISSVIVAWAWLFPEETVLFGCLLPMKAKWIGWISIALLYFTFPPPIGAARFILGFFALGGVAAAYGYVWYQKTWAWIPRRPKDKKRKVLRHPASSPWRRLLRPFEEWQRRRRISQLERTFKFDEDETVE